MQSGDLRLSLLVLAVTSPLLAGFNGGRGPETEALMGVGIGSVVTGPDRDNHGEVGVQLLQKFWHHPYDHRAPWLGISASWLTFPAGGDVGNQMLTVGFMGGVVTQWGEFGLGAALFGDLTDVGIQVPLPIVRVAAGVPGRFKVRFGVLDDAPTWTTGGMMHWDLVLSLPFDKVWAPQLTVGARMDMYGVPSGRFPLEVFLGIEPRLGRHVRIGLFGALGDGMGGAPTFHASLRLGLQFGKGVTSDSRPLPPS